MSIATGQKGKASDFINESEKDATPANDAGRVPKLESDAKISGAFLRAPIIKKFIALSGTFTVTIASPAVFTLNGHGYVLNDKVVFSTTGALPTGLTAGQIYYVISAGLGANTFQVSTTLDGSAVNTSGTQSGVHTVKSVWTKPSGLNYIIVEVQASGGGSAGCDEDYDYGGGTAGAGAGGYSKKIILAETLGATEIVTVGAGGAGGAGGRVPTNGSDGSVSSFGSHCSTTGGIHSSITNEGNYTGGSGGSASGGDLNLTGGSGGFGMQGNLEDQPVYGLGGQSILGNYGRGGNGSFDPNDYGFGGNAGGQGIVVITEYY